ncbi:MAG: hypothetical protein HYW48_06850 [Deltaproteobacteria bacterium]|nr:hypothetical protein [Deltaproteobacteria bacterium]
MRKNPQASFNLWITDLLASMVFVFLLILVIHSLALKTEQEKLLREKEKLQHPLTLRQNILEKVQALLNQEGLEAQVLVKEGILRLTEKTIAFPIGQAMPYKEQLENLAKLANVLQSVLPCFSHQPGSEATGEAPPAWCSQKEIPPSTCPSQSRGSLDTILVEGHTDAMPLKPGLMFRDNLSLSASRATTVLRVLKSCRNELDGLSNKRGHPLLAASGYSYLRPIVAEDPNDPRNRRIDIRFLMSFDSPSGMEEP